MACHGVHISPPRPPSGPTGALRPDANHNPAAPTAPPLPRLTRSRPCSAPSAAPLECCRRCAPCVVRLSRRDGAPSNPPPLPPRKPSCASASPAPSPSSLPLAKAMLHTARPALPACPPARVLHPRAWACAIGHLAALLAQFPAALLLRQHVSAPMDHRCLWQRRSTQAGLQQPARLGHTPLCQPPTHAWRRRHFDRGTSPSLCDALHCSGRCRHRALRGAPQPGSSAS